MRRALAHRAWEPSANTGRVFPVIWWNAALPSLIWQDDIDAATQRNCVSLALENLANQAFITGQVVSELEPIRCERTAISSKVRKARRAK